jgi:hypothetical protein
MGWNLAVKAQGWAFRASTGSDLAVGSQRLPRFAAGLRTQLYRICTG